MTVIRSEPDVITHYSHETLPWRFDFTSVLGEDALSSAVSYLVDLRSGQAYAAPIASVPTVASPHVTQVVATPRPGRYRLSVVGTVSATKVWEIPVILEVPY